MKVLYDYQIFRKQRYGGISRYFTNLIRCAKEDEAEVVVPCFHPKNYYYNRLIDGFDHKYESMIFEYLNDMLSRTLTKMALKNKDIKIFHPTYHDPYFLSLIKDEKVVVTVHDLAVERYPENFNNVEAFVENRKKLLKAADHIIAVSNNTKSELEDYYGISPEKVTVVYHGLSNDFGKISIHLRGLPEKFLLYVGQRGGTKNFDRFIEAYKACAMKDSSLYLLCVGGGEFTEIEKDKLIEMGIDRKVQQRSLNDAILAACYKQAEAFVFPSLYEGFGIPVLEAFSMGCPVILSDIGSFREVAVEEGHYFDPMSIDAMQTTIEWVLSEENKLIVDQKVERAKERVSAFTLGNTYDHTWQVYKRLLKE